jgi:hypothetical protein
MAKITFIPTGQTTLTAEEREQRIMLLAAAMRALGTQARFLLDECFLADEIEQAEALDEVASKLNSAVVQTHPFINDRDLSHPSTIARPHNGTAFSTRMGQTFFNSRVLRRAIRLNVDRHPG